MPKAAARIPQPPRLGDEPEEGLHHREGDQLGVEIRGNIPIADRHGAHSGQIFQQVIGTDVECGSEGVKVGVHNGLPARSWGR